MRRSNRLPRALAGLALALCVTLAGGCRRAGPAAPEAPPAPEAEPAPGATVVTIADYDNGGWGNDRISDYLRERLHIVLSPRPYSSSDLSSRWNDEVAVWAMQDDLPDVFFTKGIHDNEAYHELIDSGAIRPIPLDSLMERPHIRQLLQDNPIYRQFLVDGELYAIPRTFWQTQGEDFKGQVAWCRKDWREALGIPPPETLEDWTAMMDAFANRDPDGNGVKDTYGVCYYDQELPPFLMLANGAVFDEWVCDGGRWVYGCCSPRVAPGIEYCRGLYRRGILDPSYIALKDLRQVLDRFVTDKTGVALYGSMPDEVEDLYVSFEQANPGKSADDCVEHLPYPPGPDGKVRIQAAFNWWNAISFSSRVDDAKLELILDLFEWTLTEEGERMTLYGFEGEDYELVDGEPVNLLGKRADGLSMTAADRYPTAAVGYYLNKKSTQRLNGTLTDEKYVRISREIRRHYLGKGLENEIDIRVKFLYTERKARLNLLPAFWKKANELVLSPQDTDVAQAMAAYWEEYDREHPVFAAFDEVNAVLAGSAPPAQTS